MHELFLSISVDGILCTNRLSPVKPFSLVVYVLDLYGLSASKQKYKFFGNAHSPKLRSEKSCEQFKDSES